EVFDLKVDLLQYIRQTERAKHSKIKLEHKFHFEDITEKDCLLMQVPNINESGYYSGIVGLKSYVDKFHPDLKVQIIDPVIDYFFLNPPDKQGEFFNLFNTFSKQGKFHLLYNHQQIFDIAYGFVGRYIEKAKPGFLGFSIIDGNIDASLAIAKLIKEKYPEVKILFGGNGVEVLDFGRLPNSNYRTKEYTFIDGISRGDGEMTFVEILKSDWSEESLMKINGLIWQLNGVFIHNRPRPNIDMDSLPYPDYSSLEDNYYYKSTYQHNVPLVMSRGCPYRCSFCSVPDYIPEFRYRNVDNVLDEIKYWVSKGETNFFCHDSIINGNPKWLKEFCEKIIENDLKITWGGNMRLQSTMRDLDTMRLYRKAGLMKMITGFESASEPVLRHMKKYTNTEGVKEIFENVRIINSENEYPMQFAMQLIIGYLNEGEEDFQRTMDFIEEYHDCMAEILTCSAFLIHGPLLTRWRDEEKEWIEYINGVNFSTKWNTPMDRLERLDRIENLFIKIGIPYSV
ncbi:radical SAM protein, partial [bacterium]|nr:radical SAM protein [bacterium]